MFIDTFVNLCLTDGALDKKVHFFTCF